MLNKEAFFNGIEKLIIEFEDKGFRMNEMKSKQWFSFMQDMTEWEYNRRIDLVLMTVNKAPSMADIFSSSITEIINKEKEEAKVPKYSGKIAYYWSGADPIEVNKAVAKGMGIKHWDSKEECIKANTGGKK